VWVTARSSPLQQPGDPGLCVNVRLLRGLIFLSKTRDISPFLFFKFRKGSANGYLTVASASTRLTWAYFLLRLPVTPLFEFTRPICSAPPGPAGGEDPSPQQFVADLRCKCTPSADDTIAQIVVRWYISYLAARRLPGRV